MNNDDELMSAEEFFGELANEKKVPVRKGRRRVKKSANDLFTEVKVKMVMRIYGVTKARAQEIIAGRAEEAQKLERGKGASEKAKRGRHDGGFISAEEFFGTSN